MLYSDSDIFALLGNERPGRELIAIEDAALPVTIVRTTVLAQERKEVPLLDEYVLRLIRGGVEDGAELAAFLGLEVPIVEGALAEQARWGNLVLPDGHRSLGLTPLGERVVQDLESVVPVQKDVPVAFDRLTWSVANYRRSDLIQAKDARSAGMYMLPASSKARISMPDVPPQQIAGLVESGSIDIRRSFEVLAVKKVTPSAHLYLPVKMLIYGDSARGETDIAVSIDGILSPEHENRIANRGGALSLGVRVGEPAAPPAIPGEFESVKIKLEDVFELRTDDSSRRTPKGDRGSRHRSGTNARTTLEECVARDIAPGEQPDLLNHALECASERIMIRSSGLRAGVFNSTIANWLDNRLRKGVKVHIGYTQKDGDFIVDDSAVSRLNSLSSRFPNLIVGEFHDDSPNVLLFDNTVVFSTSGWLSYKGIRTGPYRREAGVLVRSKELSDEIFDRNSSSFPDRSQEV